MFASFLINLREGLEAALIVGIVLSVLRKLGQSDRSRLHLPTRNTLTELSAGAHEPCSSICRETNLCPPSVR